MIEIGKTAPAFRLPGVRAGRAVEFKLSDFRRRWLALFFYPADFTFICPTEVLGFHKRFSDFEQADCAIVGISVDDVETHLKWVAELGEVSYPLLSDFTKETSRAYAVFDETEGVAIRATFIINPAGVVAYETAITMNVGRSVEETYRVLKALQTGRMCPADWKPGEETGDLLLKY